MTDEEREVIEAAKAAVVVTHLARVDTADISSDPEKIGRLVSAVYRLTLKKRNVDYWRTT